jgi:protein-S-isoprenylcysteine O-methyltransferase Ste14
VADSGGVGSRDAVAWNAWQHRDAPEQTNHPFDRSGGKPRFGKRGELLVAAQFALMIGFALLPVWHPGVGAALMDASLIWRTIGAGALALTALALGGFGSHHIREYLTPLPYPVEHSQLVQHGVYSIVRHPLYASLLFLGAGWTIYNLSLSHLVALIGCFLFGSALFYMISLIRMP